MVVPRPVRYLPLANCKHDVTALWYVPGPDKPLPGWATCLGLRVANRTSPLPHAELPGIPPTQNKRVGIAANPLFSDAPRRI